RCIIRYASIRCIALSVSTPVRGFAGAADTGSVDIGIEVRFQIMMRRHLVALAALFMQPHPPAFSLRVIILNPHRNGGSDTREGECHLPRRVPDPAGQPQLTYRYYQAAHTLALPSAPSFYRAS